MEEKTIKTSDKVKTNAVLFTGTGLAIIGTTCCALPIVLVSLGLGGAMASLVSNVPWLITLSKYKLITFSVTGLILGYCWFMLYWLEKRPSTSGRSCSMRDQKLIKWQKRMLWFSTFLLFVSVLAAYAFLPIRIWIDERFGF